MSTFIRYRGIATALSSIALLLTFPFVANEFWVMHVAGQTFGFGTIVLSLIFLVAFGGMLSLAQMTVAGVAGYALAYCTSPGTALGWAAALPISLGCAVVSSIAIGFVAVRTEGIYTLMITLAIAMGFYSLVLGNYTVFNGYTGYTQVPVPVVLGISLQGPQVFYYLNLAFAAFCFALVRHLATTPFGLALQAARDNPRRLRALGYPIAALRVMAFGVAGLIAGIGGILNVWLNGSISPGSVDIGATINVLIAAVLGGLRHPIGAFVGAFAFTVLQSLTIEFIAPERFNTIIGLVFIAVVVFSPDGIVGAWRLASRRLELGLSLLRQRAANASAAPDSNRVHDAPGGNTHV